MKESYLKIEEEIENLKKAVTEGNSAKAELAKLQKKLDGIKLLANEYAKEIEDGDGGNKENEAENWSVSDMITNLSRLISKTHPFSTYILTFGCLKVLL